MKLRRICIFLILSIVIIPGIWAQGTSRVRASYDSGNAAAGVFGFGLAAQYSQTFDLGDTSLGHFVAVGYFAELEYVTFGGTSLFAAAGGVEFLGLWILNAQAGIGYISVNGSSP